MNFLRRHFSFNEKSYDLIVLFLLLSKVYYTNEMTDDPQGQDNYEK